VKQFSASLRRKARKIKLLLLDVDGVLTDGAITINDEGVESKSFHVRDGHGIVLLLRFGIEVGFITGRSSKVVQRRAQELGVQLVYQGIENKADAYSEIKRRNGLTDEQIAYVGDDLTDVPVFQCCGLAITVEDGWPELKARVDYVTETAGGRGAVREVSELLLKAQGQWAVATKPRKLS
jgi:3-deoxy-D-manno-octulosonate 8-phosphate phosphatase (KDO 8-P phosphatase)